MLKLPQSKVVLKRLTKADLKKWLPKRDVKRVIDEIFFDENNNDLFPKIPILHSKECDKLLGLKKKSLKRLSTKDPLSLTNVVSEDENAEVSKQKLTVYKCLLSEITGIHSDTRPVMSLKKDKPKPRWSSSKYKQWKGKDELGHLSWLKSEKTLVEADVERKLTNFLNRRNNSTNTVDDYSVKRNCDDNISILSLSMSSDDESYNSRCCAECRRKKRCMCSPLSVSPCDKLNRVKSENDVNGCLGEMLNCKPISNCTSLTVPPSVDCSCNCLDSLNKETDILLKSLPSPPPSAQKKSNVQISPGSDFSSEGRTTDSENSIVTKKSPYRLREASPRKSYPDFELYMHRKMQTTALGERIDNLCNLNNNKTDKPQKTVSSGSNKPHKIGYGISQPGFDVLRRSKRIRSPTLLCNESPAKLRKLETR